MQGTTAVSCLIAKNNFTKPTISKVFSRCFLFLRMSTLKQANNIAVFQKRGGGLMVLWQLWKFDPLEFLDDTLPYKLI